jgi:4-amino-4-deoxy-L-arabinose transferase-like glycosyltransferase
MIVNRKRGQDSFSLSGVLVVYPLFVFFQILLSKMLHYLHLLNAPMHLLAYYLLIAALLYWVSKVGVVPGRLLTPGEPVQLIVLATAGMILVLVSVIALAEPPLSWDDNVYHLPMVAQYFQNHSLSPWATQCLRQIARPNGSELQMLHLAFFSGSDAWLELPHLLGFFVILVATFQIATLILQKKNLAFLTVILILTAPQFAVIAGTYRNDLIFVAFVLTAFYWVIRTVCNRLEKPGFNMGLAGLSVGLASSTKVMGPCLLVSIVSVLLFMALFKKVSWTSLGWFLFSAFASTILLVGEIYWRNFNLFGIPVGVVPDEDRGNKFGFGWPALQSIFTYYFHTLGIKRLFLQEFSSPGRSHFGYFFHPMLVMGVFAAFRQGIRLKSEQGKALRILSLLALTLFVAVYAYRAPASHDQRWMSWLVPVVAILTLSLFESWSEERIRKVTAALSVYVLIYTAYLCFGPSDYGRNNRSSIAYLFQRGRPARASDLRLRGSLKERFENYWVLNAQARKRDHVLFVGGGWSIMYPSWGRNFGRVVDGVANLNDALEKMDSGRYRFIIVDNDAKPELREAALTKVNALGYGGIASDSYRTLYKRPD